MSKGPRQHKPFKPTLRDGYAAVSVALRVTHGFAKHFECDPAFFDTLKALQLQADRSERALSREGTPIDPVIKTAFDLGEYDPTPGPKLALDAPSSIWDFADKTADTPVPKHG